MSWQLTADRPIYLQLIEEIELRIVSGMYTCLLYTSPSPRDS